MLSESKAMMRRYIPLFSLDPDAAALEDNEVESFAMQRMPLGRRSKMDAYLVADLPDSSEVALLEGNLQVTRP